MWWMKSNPKNQRHYLLNLHDTHVLNHFESNHESVDLVHKAGVNDSSTVRFKILTAISVISSFFCLFMCIPVCTILVLIKKKD